MAGVDLELRVLLSEDVKFGLDLAEVVPQHLLLLIHHNLRCMTLIISSRL